MKYHGTACTGWFVLPIGFVIWRRRWLTAKLRIQTQVFSISHGDEGDEGREGDMMKAQKTKQRAGTKQRAAMKRGHSAMKAAKAAAPPKAMKAMKK